MKTLLWDLDDTLIRTQEHYDLVGKNTSQLICQLLDEDSLDWESVKDKMSEIDIQNAKRYGLSPLRYLSSWEETYAFFCQLHGKEVGDKEKVLVRKQGNEIFQMNLPLYDEALFILKKIASQGYDMMLLTAGDEEVQQKRIEDAKLRSYFSDIHIVPDKNPQTMKQVLGHRLPQDCVMIGNSLRSNIYPALENGMKAIHVERNTWAYDHHQVDTKHPNYIAVANLFQVLDALHHLKNIAV